MKKIGFCSVFVLFDFDITVSLRGEETSTIISKDTNCRTFEQKLFMILVERHYVKRSFSKKHDLKATRKRVINRLMETSIYRDKQT